MVKHPHDTQELAAVVLLVGVLSAIKTISRERSASNGPAFQSPKTSRISNPERLTSASTCSRDGNRSVLLVVTVLSERRYDVWNEMNSPFAPVMVKTSLNCPPRSSRDRSFHSP